MQVLIELIYHKKIIYCIYICSKLVYTSEAGYILFYLQRRDAVI